ncbi:hypothetical protein TSAR_006889, partial [Trichomalopsis sarcophagae]
SLCTRTARAHTRQFHFISLTQRSRYRGLAYSSFAFLLLKTTYRIVAAGESFLRGARKPHVPRSRLASRDRSLSSAVPRKVGRWLVLWRPSCPVFFSAFPILSDCR